MGNSYRKVGLVFIQIKTEINMWDAFGCDRKIREINVDFELPHSPVSTATTCAPSPSGGTLDLQSRGKSFVHTNSIQGFGTHKCIHTFCPRIL